MKELADLDALGGEIRNIFRNRLKKKFENQEQRLLGDSAMALDMWAEYRLIKKVKETPTVTSFKFTAVHPRQPTEPVLPGTHVRLKLGGRLIRAYSVVEGSRNQFTLGVALDRQSTRGGSLFLHENLQEGDTITISNLAATFPLAEKGRPPYSHRRWYRNHWFACIGSKTAANEPRLSSSLRGSIAG